MRFATIEVAGSPAWGVVVDDEIVLLDHYPTLRAAIAADALNIDRAVPPSGRRVPLRGARWLPVIPDPGKILCVGLNYQKHRQETGRPEVAHPTIFIRFSDSQTGHQEAIILPGESEQLDYEGELAVIIGRGGRRIAAADALRHVAGYACYNDGSVRDWQAHTMQFIPGKNWPGTGAFGPWMVTPDEFGALGPQRLQTRLNGEIMQDTTLDEMIFSVPRLVEYISTFTPLSPGDVIVTGTPGGVGVKRNPPVFMREGDRVEVEIAGIGTLANRIAQDA